MRRFRSATRFLTWGLVAALPLLTVALAVLAQSSGKAKPAGRAATAADGKQPAADGAPPDPAQAREEYFKGWPKPKLAIVITGRQDGYIEPCGCAGLENQKGGLSRRDTMIAGLAKKGWPLLPIDVGGLIHRFGKQAELKFGMSVEALKKMQYKAVAFGTDDLRLSAGDIAAVVAGPDPADNLFVAANVGLFDLTSGLTATVKVVAAGGMTVGITSVLGDQYQKAINNQDIVFKPAAAGLKEVMPQLADCDLRILLAHATMKETEKLAAAFPKFNVVVCSDGGDEPPNRPGKINGTSAKLIEVGHKGMFAVVLGFYDNPKQPMLYQRVALDSRYAASDRMKELMQQYQSQLSLLGLEGLGVRPIPHPRAAGHDKIWGEFAGVKSCKDCHPTAYKIWKNSKHAQATEALKKADPQRIFDPECLSCHVTGWNPQEFFPYASGFVSPEATPDLVGNTCENCHGPCAAHNAAENGKDYAKREEQRAIVRLTKAQAEQNVCIKCHDLDNSPNFSKPGTFDKDYWPKVEHKGKR